MNKNSFLQYDVKLLIATVSAKTFGYPRKAGKVCQVSGNRPSLFSGLIRVDVEERNRCGSDSSRPKLCFATDVRESTDCLSPKGCYPGCSTSCCLEDPVEGSRPLSQD